MVAQKLKMLRAMHKLTQNEVAIVLNISREAYSMYENGKRQLNYESLCAIADYYQVSLDYLFDRTETPELPIPLNEEEQVLLSRYRNLDTRGKENILNMTGLEYQREGKDHKQNFTGSAM